jgi:NitT/TauT family transport system substrate-binding protein
MHARWLFSTIVALAFVVISVAGYLALLGPVAGVGDDNRLRLAINPWPGYELLYLAHVREHYRQEGLDVDLVQFSTLDDARRSFERGQVDAIATTLVDVVQIYHGTGERPAVILVTDYSAGADVIIARGQGIASPRDLKGKTVAVEQMFGRFVLSAALGRHGLTLDDVKVFEASVLEGATLLASKEVDAVVTYAPQSLAASAVPGTRTIFSSTDVPGQILDVVAVRQSVLKRIPNLPERLAAVWGRALETLRDHPGEAIRIMARREGLSDEEFRRALADVHLVEEINQARMLAAGGQIEQALKQIARFDGWKGPVERPRPEASAFLAPATRLGSTH